MLPGSSGAWWCASCATLAPLRWSSGTTDLRSFALSTRKTFWPFLKAYQKPLSTRQIKCSLSSHRREAGQEWSHGLNMTSFTLFWWVCFHVQSWSYCQRALRAAVSLRAKTSCLLQEEWILFNSSMREHKLFGLCYQWLFLSSSCCTPVAQDIQQLVLAMHLWGRHS